jgi:hypothetical protein
MNLILHIGPHKTGSTAIQTFLNSARQELLTDGILYPFKGRLEEDVTCHLRSPQRYVRGTRFFSKSGPDFAHHLLEWTLAGMAQNISAERCWLELLKEIESIKPETTIISSEYFAWLSKEQLQKVKLLLKDYSVSILIFFRNPLKWQLSRYNQMVKKGNYRRSFRAFFREPSSQFISYERLINRYVNIFGQKNVELRLFDKITHHGTLEHDFIHMLGINALKYEKYISHEIKNVSLAPDITNMLRYLNSFQHYLAPRSMHSTRIRKLRKKIIRKRSTYNTLNKYGKPIFNRPVYNRRDIKIFSKMTEKWLPEFLHRYLNPEDWAYYKIDPFDQEK